jgi:hypothetical protein
MDSGLAARSGKPAFAGEPGMAAMRCVSIKPIREMEFPVPTGKFPVPAKKFPVLSGSGNLPFNPLKLQRNIPVFRAPGNLTTTH